MLTSVALRKESVDRNSTYVIRLPRCQVSLSARRAWIEIDVDIASNFKHPVALRKESVDRNKYVVQCRKVINGRSPQGERG